MSPSRLEFTGNSMLPVLHTGDRLIVEFVMPSQLIKSPAIGDIMLSHQHGEWISHRVVKLKNQLFLKGDRSGNLENYDPTCILGKIVGFERQKNTIYWGKQGQPFKQVFAWLSVNNQLDLDIGKPNKKWRRWICLIMMLALNQATRLWLMVKKPKPYGSSSF